MTYRLHMTNALCTVPTFASRLAAAAEALASAKTDRAYRKAYDAHRALLLAGPPSDMRACRLVTVTHGALGSLRTIPGGVALPVSACG